MLPIKDVPDTTRCRLELRAVAKLVDKAQVLVESLKLGDEGSVMVGLSRFPLGVEAILFAERTHLMILVLAKESTA